jgi:ribosomal-protein-alanine N-acetyltransferase
MLAHVAIGLARADEAGHIALMSRDTIEHGLSWKWTPQRVLRAVRDPEINIVVARDRAALAGFAIMQYAEQHAHLSLLGVDAAHRRQGVASALLDWLEVTARTAGLARIRVEARSDNVAARALYRKGGFREVRELLGYYQGIDDAVVLVKTLRERG